MLDWLRVSVAKIQASFSVRHLDQEFAEELQSHLAILTEDNIRKIFKLNETDNIPNISSQINDCIQEVMPSFWLAQSDVSR